jgi:ATP:cob(I)alamin adenosyltransferase
MAESGPLKQFVIPGKNLASAQLHVARTLSRRLERLLTAMDRAPLRDELKRYINRLSDALFSMARIEETRPDACA